MPKGSEEVVMSGLFSWVTAFQEFGGRGESSALTARDWLEQFDYIHVNFTPGNPNYIDGIKDVLGDHSDTKVIANVDYAVYMFNSIDPFILRHSLGLADFVFHVEPEGAARLGAFLGREVPAIPHPADIVKIKKFRSPSKHPIVVACQYHRYLFGWPQYFYSTYPIRKTHPDIRVVLMNYSSEQRSVVAMDGLFDEVPERVPYPAYLDMLSDCYLNMDVTQDFTFGRGVVDAAALGVPTIGSNTIDAMNRIWPELAVNPQDTGGMTTLLNSLLLDREFAGEMSAQGTERCEYYSLENSYKRLVEYLESTTHD